MHILFHVTCILHPKRVSLLHLSQGNTEKKNKACAKGIRKAAAICWDRCCRASRCYNTWICWFLMLPPIGNTPVEI